APELEGSGALEVLAFEEELRVDAIVHAAGRGHGRFVCDTGELRGGAFDVGKPRRVHGSLVYPDTCPPPPRQVIRNLSEFLACRNAPPSRRHRFGSGDQPLPPFSLPSALCHAAPRRPIRHRGSRAVMTTLRFCGTRSRPTTPKEQHDRACRGSTNRSSNCRRIDESG